MSIIQAIVLSIVEGITEFLPIASTGHMIIGSSVMGIAHDEFVKVFTVSIQFGAILSVIALYWRRFIQSFDFYVKLFIAFLPAAIIGKLLSKLIDALLGDVLVVAIMLIVGGFIFLFVDRWFSGRELEPTQPFDVSHKSALKIGFFQTIAMVPGVSRSAATIIGGLTQGLTRRQAAEFSFFLAVPTMFAATVYKLYAYKKAGFLMTGNDIHLLIIGNVIAFLVAMAAIRSFIGYLSRHGFRAFGYYRIALGLLILGVDIFFPCFLHLL